MYYIYHAWPQDCAECPVRLRCLSKSTASRRYLSVQVEEPEPNVLDEMKAKIDSPPGKKIYARRLGIVEPVFANICVHKHMNRFTLRTKSKVDVQMEAIRPGAQYWKNLRFWDASVAPGDGYPDPSRILPLKLTS